MSNKKTMYCALMSSESLEWIAFGESEKEAKQEIVNEWNKNPRTTKLNLKTLEEFYGIVVIEVKKGCTVW